LTAYQNELRNTVTAFVKSHKVMLGGSSVGGGFLLVFCKHLEGYYEIALGHTVNIQQPITIL